MNNRRSRRNSTPIRGVPTKGGMKTPTQLINYSTPKKDLIYHPSYLKHNIKMNQTDIIGNIRATYDMKTANGDIVFDEECGLSETHCFIYGLVDKILILSSTTTHIKSIINLPESILNENNETTIISMKFVNNKIIIVTCSDNINYFMGTLSFGSNASIVTSNDWKIKPFKDYIEYNGNWKMIAIMGKYLCKINETKDYLYLTRILLIGYPLQHHEAVRWINSDNDEILMIIPSIGDVIIFLTSKEIEMLTKNYLIIKKIFKFPLNTSKERGFQYKTPLYVSRFKAYFIYNRIILLVDYTQLCFFTLDIKIGSKFYEVFLNHGFNFPVLKPNSSFINMKQEIFYLIKADQSNYARYNRTVNRKNMTLQQFNVKCPAQNQQWTKLMNLIPAQLINEISGSSSRIDYYIIGCYNSTLPNSFGQTNLPSYLKDLIKLFVNPLLFTNPLL